MIKIFIFPPNRQRTILWKYFYPPDFQPMVPTKTPQIGDKRLSKLFKFSLNFLHESDIELPFTEGDKVHFMHLSCGMVRLKISFFDNLKESKNLCLLLSDNKPLIESHSFLCYFQARSNCNLICSL